MLFGEIAKPAGFIGGILMSVNQISYKLRKKYPNSIFLKASDVIMLMNIAELYNKFIKGENK